MVRPLAIILGLVALQGTSAEEPQHYDTPRDRFFALGGRETHVHVTAHGRDLTTDDIAQKRDLAQYADGGSFDAGFNGRRDPSVVRRFIWSCWEHHRRGYIRYGGFTVDASGTS